MRGGVPRGDSPFSWSFSSSSFLSSLFSGTLLHHRASGRQRKRGRGFARAPSRWRRFCCCCLRRSSHHRARMCCMCLFKEKFDRFFFFEKIKKNLNTRPTAVSSKFLKSIKARYKKKGRYRRKRRKTTTEKASLPPLLVAKTRGGLCPTTIT